jgi:excisionase family DNA binding protein
MAERRVAKVVYDDGTSRDVPPRLQGVVTALVGDDDLTTTEAAQLLGVSREWVARLVDRGELRGHRVGRHRRVSRHDALDYWRRKHRGVDESANAADFAEVLELADAMPKRRRAEAPVFPRIGKRP